MTTFTTPFEDRQIEAARSSPDHISDLLDIIGRADTRVGELETLLTEKENTIRDLERELDEARLSGA